MLSLFSCNRSQNKVVEEQVFIHGGEETYRCITEDVSVSIFRIRGVDVQLLVMPLCISGARIIDFSINHIDILANS